MKLMGGPFILSENEIIAIKTGNIPDKVIEEGDSLNIGSSIHSFYWLSDLYKLHDYEPVAVCKDDRSCLTRVHYHGLVVWQEFTEYKNKPVVYFKSLFHTPVICSVQKITFWEPDNYIDRAVLKGYFIPKILEMRNEDQLNYTVTGYSDKMVKENVPEASKFTWNDLKYFVLIAPVTKLEDLNVGQRLKDNLPSLH
jgi:hypothetical protein